MLLVLAVAMVVRLVWIVLAARRPTEFGDPFSYLYHAEDIAVGYGYRTYLAGDATAYFPVGWPAALGLVLRAIRVVVPGASVMQALAVANVAAGTATAGVTMAATRHLADRRTALVAGMLVAVFPGLVLWSATAHLETFFTFLVVLIAWWLVRHPSERSWSAVDLAVLGALFGATALVRPIVLAFLPVLGVLWWRDASHRRWARDLAAVLVVAAVVIAPWSIRNTMRFDRLVVISTNTGDNLCVGHSARADGRYQHLGDYCWEGYEDLPPSTLETTRDRENTSRALRYALGHPVREVELLGRKVWALVVGDHEGVTAVERGGPTVLSSGWSLALKVLADVWYTLAVVLAAIGLVRLRAEGRRAWRVVLAWAATLLAVPLLFFGGTRFHVPVLPFVAMLAAVALTGWHGGGRADASPRDDVSRGDEPGEDEPRDDAFMEGGRLGSATSES